MKTPKREWIMCYDGFLLHNVGALLNVSTFLEAARLLEFVQLTRQKCLPHPAYHPHMPVAAGQT